MPETVGTVDVIIRLDDTAVSKGVSSVRREVDNAFSSLEKNAGRTARGIDLSLGRSLQDLSRVDLTRAFGSILTAGAGALALNNLASAAFRAETGMRLFETQLKRNNIPLEEGKRAIQSMADELGVLPQDLADNVTQLLRMGLKMDEIRQAFIGGAASALAFGTSAANGVNHATVAIVTGMSRQLDAIGISQNLAEAYKSYAKELGKTVDALNQTERAQAAVQLITKYTVEEVASLPTLLSGYAGAMNRARKASIEFSTTLGKAVQPTVIAAVDTFSKIVEFANALPAPMLKAGAGAATAAIGITTAAAAVRALTLAFGPLLGPGGILLLAVAAFGALAAGYENAAAVIDKSKKRLDDLAREADKAATGLRDVAKASSADELLGNVRDLADLLEGDAKTAFQDWAKSTLPAILAQGELQDAIGATIDAFAVAAPRAARAGDRRRTKPQAAARGAEAGAGRAVDSANLRRRRRRAGFLGVRLPCNPPNVPATRRHDQEPHATSDCVLQAQLDGTTSALSALTNEFDTLTTIENDFAAGTITAEQRQRAFIETVFGTAKALEIYKAAADDAATTTGIPNPDPNSAASDAAEKITKTLTDLKAALAAADEQGKVFGATFDVAGTKIELVRNAIISLLEQGLPSTDKRVGDLRDQFYALGGSAKDLADALDQLREQKVRLSQAFAEKLILKATYQIDDVASIRSQLEGALAGLKAELEGFKARPFDQETLVEFLTLTDRIQVVQDALEQLNKVDLTPARLNLQKLVADAESGRQPLVAIRDQLTLLQQGISAKIADLTRDGLTVEELQPYQDLIDLLAKVREALDGTNQKLLDSPTAMDGITAALRRNRDAAELLVERYGGRAGLKFTIDAVTRGSRDWGEALTALTNANIPQTADVLEILAARFGEVEASIPEAGIFDPVRQALERNAAAAQVLADRYGGNNGVLFSVEALLRGTRSLGEAFTVLTNHHIRITADVLQLVTDRFNAAADAAGAADAAATAAARNAAAAKVVQDRFTGPEALSRATIQAIEQSYGVFDGLGDALHKFAQAKVVVTDDILKMLTDRFASVPGAATDKILELQHQLVALRNSADPADEAIKALVLQIDNLRLKGALDELGKKGAANLDAATFAFLKAKGVISDFGSDSKASLGDAEQAFQRLRDRMQEAAGTAPTSLEAFRRELFQMAGDGKLAADRDR